MSPTVSVVIPVYQRADLTELCLRALEAQGLDGVETVVVDNASTDGTPALLEAWGERLTVVRNSVNRGFAAGCNQGARAASAPVVVFLNNDTEVHSGWLDPLLDAVADERVGVAGSRLLYPNGRIQHAGMAVMNGGEVVHIHRFAPGDHPVVKRTRDLTVITGACMALRRDRFLAMGGFDEGYRNGYEDTDLCMRLATMGLVARYCGDSVITHHESASPGRHDSDFANGARYRDLWRDAPPDHARLLAEDGLIDLCSPGVIWRGPLLDASLEAAAARSAVTDLERRGWRPAVHEAPMDAAEPGLGHDLTTLAAVNRLYMSRGPGRVIHHLVPGGPEGWPAPGAELVAVVGPQAHRPSGYAYDTRRVVTFGDGQGPTGAVAAAPDSIVDALEPFVDRPEGIGFWGAAIGTTPEAVAGRELLAAITVSDRPVRIVAGDADGQTDTALLPPTGPQDFMPDIWLAAGPPVSRNGTPEWDRLVGAIGGRVIGRPWTAAAEWPSSWLPRFDATDDLWVASRMHRDALVAQGLDASRIAIVPQPIDIDTHRPREQARDDSPITFVAICRPGWGGGADLAVSAFVQEFSQQEPIRLRLIADGTTITNLEHEVLEVLARLDRDPATIADIELIALAPGAAYPAAAVRDADAVVSVPRLDTFGSDVLRALAFGVPVIACADGHHGHLVDSRGGFAVDLAARPLIPWQRAGEAAEPRGLHGLEVSVASLARRMREVADDPGGARRGALFTVTAVREFASTAAVSAIVERRLERLVRRPARLYRAAA